MGKKNKNTGNNENKPIIRPTDKQWNEFVKEYLVFEGDSNVKGDFASISPKAGVPYFEYLRAAWAANDGMFTEEEFCKINGNVPLGFFQNKIRDSGIEYEVSITEF